MPHILQPKHTIIKSQDAEKILLKYNVSLVQLPKIHLADPALPKGAIVGDVVTCVTFVVGIVVMGVTGGVGVLPDPDTRLPDTIVL